MSKKLFIKRTPIGAHDEIYLEGEVPHFEKEEITLEDATEMFNSGVGIISYDAEMFIRGKK